MRISDLKIKIIPFQEDNYVEHHNYLVGRILNFQPISNEGSNNIIQNKDNIDYNSTGFNAYCNKLLNDEELELIVKKGVLTGKISGIKSVYSTCPDFIFGELVESTNKTIRKGHINEIIWHNKDEEFKYIINDLKGKKISKLYSSKDLIKK